MTRTYTIISFDELNGSVVASVEGYQPMNIELPLYDGLYPVGAELDQYILGFFPPVDTTRKDALSQGVPNTAVIAGMVAPSATQESPSQEQNMLMLAQAHFESQVAKALVKFGVLTEDPTAINTTQL